MAANKKCGIESFIYDTHDPSSKLTGDLLIFALIRVIRVIFSSLYLTDELLMILSILHGSSKLVTEQFFWNFTNTPSFIIMTTGRFWSLVTL